MKLPDRIERILKHWVGPGLILVVYLLSASYVARIASSGGGKEAVAEGRKVIRVAQEDNLYMRFSPFSRRPENLRSVHRRVSGNLSRSGAGELSNEAQPQSRQPAADPSCKALADHLLDKIHRRWSARRMLDGYAKERRAQDLLRRCGHPPIPHALQHDSPAEDANQFDFSQVPNWEAIKSRAAREDNLPDTSS